MKPYLTQIPEDSIIKVALAKTDYEDAFGILIPSEKSVRLKDLPSVFFQVFPKWFTGLLYIRESIAALIGLKTATGLDVEKQLREFKGEVGDSIALFHVLGRSETEIMTGENDSHLNFRLSFFSIDKEEHSEIVLATTVQFNNWVGKLYFLPVKPIHRLIVPILLKRMAKQMMEMDD